MTREDLDQRGNPRVSPLGRSVDRRKVSTREMRALLHVETIYLALYPAQRPVINNKLFS